ncbi:MAG TPA: hypothetical protein ENJ99_00640, partial [Rhizobiales bacterium]|nr:hypothetical protein [Hyphomicrobiales bacterium]
MKIAATTALLAVVLCNTAIAASTPDIKAGREASQKHCARCHVIGAYNPGDGISTTPSFQLLVNALKDYEDRFNNFYARPPHPAIISVRGIKKINDLPYTSAPIEITREDIKNIAAFA